MPRIRTIKPEFFAHEELGSCSFPARLLAIGLLQLVDGHGRMRWSAKQVEAHVFPWDEVDLGSLVEELIGAEYLVRYQVGSRSYAEIPNFRRHQRLSGKEAEAESKHPSSERGTTLPGENPSASRGSNENPRNREQGTGNREREQERVSAPVGLLSEQHSPGQVKDDSVTQVWVGYVEGRSKQREVPGKDATRRIRSALKEYSVGELVRVSRWVLQSPEWWCVRQRESGNTTYTTIYKPTGLQDRVDKAAAWEEAGAEQAPLSASEHWSGWSPEKREEHKDDNEGCKWDGDAQCYRHLVTGKYHPIHGYFSGRLPWAREWCERRAELHVDDQASDPDRYADLMEKHNIAGPRERNAMRQWFANVDDEKTRWDEAQWRGE